MQLVSLNVINNEDTVRSIIFSRGLNIITNTGPDGNQVGKSTVLRVIKFCLGSSGEGLWKDPDSGTTNEKVKEFLVSGNVKFELTLEKENKQIHIERFLSQTNGRIYRFGKINGVSCNSATKFKSKIAEIFSHNVEQPTLNTIFNRFFRLDKPTVNNPYRFNNTYTSNDMYGLIYSYLLGFSGHEYLKKDFDYKLECKLQEDRKRSLLNGEDLIFYHDRLAAIDDRILTLQEKEESYELQGVHEDVLKKLRNVREIISTLSMKIANLELQINYNQKTVDEYLSKSYEYNHEVISKIYTEASILIPNLEKTYEESVNFHNSILSRKVEYVKGRMSSLQEEVDNLKDVLNSNLYIEQNIFRSLTSQSNLGSFLLVEKEIQNEKEERGKVSYIINEIKSIEGTLINIDEKRMLNAKILTKHMDNFEAKLDSLNSSCKKISQATFKDFNLFFASNFDEYQKELKFSIVNSDKIFGDGSPRAASMCIDMSFAKYAKDNALNLPYFTLQDYLESSDEDKLGSLFGTANQLSIQTVVSILSDKLNELNPSFARDNTILTLCQEDKFFGI
ncbi:AAA family ATPase [Vibrio campbellii]|uniref:AAA family ATPase n=1 Tax=Vibrio campbellii TaxID=680 RepID=UPI001D175930|nr:AAA family ATPase [Vibrio campbellii]MCC4222972.1 AAA family ATPase [Vibrio campbellii]